jgi:hypothetical protein
VGPVIVEAIIAFFLALAFATAKSEAAVVAPAG